MPFTLGGDQGTTQTTAVILLDEADRLMTLMTKNSAPLPAHFPQPVWVEQELMDIARTVQEVARPPIGQYAPLALGFDNRGENFLIWGAATSQPVEPARQDRKRTFRAAPAGRRAHRTPFPSTGELP